MPLFVALLLSMGCDAPTLPIERQDSAIAFSCETAKTRVEDTTEENLSSFRVTAAWRRAGYSSPELLLEHQKVQKNDEGIFTYSPLSYMPATGRVDFVAYSPADAAVNELSITNPDHFELSYDVTTDLLLQHDLLIADRLDATTSPVSLHFQHLLSSVRIEVKDNSPLYDYRLKTVMLLNIYRRGQLIGFPSGSPRTTTWYWSEQELPTTYTLLQEASLTVTDSYSDTSLPATGSLMLLPQITSAEAYVYLIYEEYASDGTKVGDVTSAFPLDATFEAGKRYCLQIAFDDSPLRSAEISPIQLIEEE